MTDRISRNPADMAKVYGPLDELFVSNCDVHLEQMSEHGFCMILTRGDDALRVTFYAPGRGRVHARVDFDEGFNVLDPRSGKGMNHRLTFTPQAYPGGRILLMLGQHEIGAIFPPPNITTLTRPEWTWRFWLGGVTATKEGRAKTEQAAMNAILAEARDWLARAGL
jgi:hypothetical protein